METNPPRKTRANRFSRTTMQHSTYIYWSYRRNAPWFSCDFAANRYRDTHRRTPFREKTSTSMDRFRYLKWTASSHTNATDTPNLPQNHRLKRQHEISRSPSARHRPSNHHPSLRSLATYRKRAGYRRFGSQKVDYWLGDGKSQQAAGITKNKFHIYKQK